MFQICSILHRHNLWTQFVQRLFSRLSVDKSIWHIRCNCDSKDFCLGWRVFSSHLGKLMFLQCTETALRLRLRMHSAPLLTSALSSFSFLPVSHSHQLSRGTLDLSSKGCWINHTSDSAVFRTNLNPPPLLSLFLRSASIYLLFCHCPRLRFFCLNYWYQIWHFVSVQGYFLWNYIGPEDKPTDKEDISVLSEAKNRG